MPGFHNVTNNLPGELKLGVMSFMTNETKILYLTQADEDVIKGLPIVISHNNVVMSALSTNGKLVLRDIDPNDTYEGGGNITSVNGKTGTVVLNAADVNALPASYLPAWGDIQSVPSQLTSVQAAATTSIRAIGSGANDSAAGNHVHAVTADANSGLAAAANLQAAFVAISGRVRNIERVPIRTITTSITLADSDSGTIIVCENATDIVITIPNTIFAGANVGIVRAGTGNVAITPAGGATLRGGSFSSIGAQYRMASLFFFRNSNGTSTEYKASETAN